MIDIKAGISLIHSGHNGKNNGRCTSEPCKGDKGLLIETAFEWRQYGQDRQRPCRQGQKQGDCQCRKENMGKL